MENYKRMKIPTVKKSSERDRTRAQLIQLARERGTIVLEKLS